MSIDHLGEIMRIERRRRRLPPDARCELCGTANQLAQRRDGSILCYACRRRAAGVGPNEADHLAGRVHFGAITVTLRANDHRRLTEFRALLGMDRWPRPDDSEPAAIAHFLGSLATVLWLVGSWHIGRPESGRSDSGPPEVGP